MDEQTVDVAAWIERFPLDIYLPKMRFLDSVTSPLDWATIEQIRQRTLAFGNFGRSNPADSLVFIAGEAATRSVTKIGGAPYRPRDLAWPQREDGRPLTFVAQFCFAHSKDILPQLPGDLLLIFARDDDLYLGDPPCLHFEWQPAGLTDLIRPEEVPPPSWIFTRGYALPHRTVDYEDESRVAELAKWVLSLAHMHPGQIRPMLRSVARFPSAKIGGLPYWFYPDQHEGIERGQILCALGDVAPGNDIAPPPRDVDWWAQTEESWQDNPQEYLTWRDGCQINFFLGDGGTVHWSVDFG